jgi:uncharacterized hydrophobic protein (TIGR00271 family)
MQNAGEIRTSRKPIQNRWFGVWGVRNYYHKLELQAQAGAEYELGYFLLIFAAGLLATGGLLANNVAVIIGSMCVAPFLGPSRAVCIGGLFLDKDIFWRGLFKQLVGLFIVGAGFAYLITMILKDNVPGIEITHEILLRAMPTPKDVILTILIAIAAGAGASLAFTADPHVVDQPWGQLIDVMIGVEIAISLLPPASVLGIGLAFGDFRVTRNAFALLAVNVMALDVLGSMLIFALRGIRKRHFNLERTMRQIVEKELKCISDTVHDCSVIDITLLGEDSAKVGIDITGHEGEFTDHLAQTIVTKIYEETKCRSQVTVKISPCQVSSSL